MRSDFVWVVCAANEFDAESVVVCLGVGEGKGKVRGCAKAWLRLATPGCRRGGAPTVAGTPGRCHKLEVVLMKVASWMTGWIAETMATC